ncbi:MAG: efflux RND transporter periplasmic adaptor subunit [Anaerolineae bacterium]|nr:efflux RND transporter periplasmic adaptor subunit [Anaerolineae bacterium]
MQKRILISAGVLVAAIVAGVTLLNPGAQTVSAQDQQTARVERRTLNSTIETTGTIEPEDSVLLSFGMAGSVSEILVEVGSEVRAGDVLARLDTSDIENQIARQEQSLIMQQASYDQLIADPSAREIAQAEATLASAQSQLIQAQINLDTAPNNLTINCANLDSAALQLERAQEDYDDYVNDGYQMDATFIPDADSEPGERLRDAQSSFDVAQAQCNETPSVEQLEAAVSAAQASVDQAQAALDELLSGPTDEEMSSAQAQLDQARLLLDDVHTSLDDAVITATFDGIISAVHITRGQLVSANTTAITLVDHAQLHVNVSVDELDIAQIATGQSALIAPEALNGQTIEGLVTRIAPTSTITDGIVTYDVRVDLTDAGSLPVRIGMTTEVEIVVGSLDAVIVVPTEAVQREGQNEFVDVLNADNSTTRVAIVSGTTIDGLTVVDGDLTEGLTVIIPQRSSAQAGNNLPFGGGN